MACGIGQAVVQIDDQRLASRLHRCLELEDREPVDLRQVLATENPRPLPATAERRACGMQPIAQHIHILAAHLQQPRGGHPRAHAVVVDQHQASVAHTHVIVGGLDQLPARSTAGAGQMAGLVFLGRSDIEQVEIAPAALLQRGQLPGIDFAHAEAPRNALRCRDGLVQRSWRGRRRHLGPTVHQRAAAQVPSGGAVLDDDDGVGNAGVDQRLCADDSTGASGTVDDDRRLIVVDQTEHAMNQLGARAGDAARQAVAVELFIRTAVEQQHVLARSHPIAQRGRRDARRRARVLDILPESLARHVDPRENLQPGRLPGAQPTAEQAQVRVAPSGQPAGSDRRHAVLRVAVVDQHHPRVAPRHQRVDEPFHPVQRQRDRRKDMPGGKLAAVPHIQQRQFCAVGKQPPYFDGAPPAPGKRGRGAVVTGLRQEEGLSLCHGPIQKECDEANIATKYVFLYFWNFNFYFSEVMSIRELESLVAIADSGSITAAAERLFLSVPAVSAQIARLEAALGTPMLEGRYKPARLNPAGTLLCERARAVLNSYRQFYETVADTADLAGVLAVGASPTVLTTVIPKTLVALRSAHPRIQIRMQYGRAWNLLKDLQHGQIDALIISQPPVSMGNTQWTQFAQEPVTVIAPPGAKGRNDESLLAEYPYIRFGQRFWVADTIAAHLAERGIVPQQIMQADSREAIALMVRHGLGVSIVPESDPPLSKLYGLHEVALGKPPLTRNIGLAQTPVNPKQALIDALLHRLTEATVSRRMKPAPSRSLGRT